MALSHPYAFHTFYNKAPTKRPCTNHVCPIDPTIRSARRPHSNASEWRHPRGLTDAVRPATNHPKAPKSTKNAFYQKILGEKFGGTENLS